MDDYDWTSEESNDSDPLSPLPRLVIWTSRRSTACSPQPTAPSYSTRYPALHHVYPNSGNEVRKMLSTPKHEKGQKLNQEHMQ